MPSPWYHYANMPGYINIVRINFDFISFEWRSGSTYRWQYDNRRNDDWGWNSNYRRDYIDEAVDDIYDSFTRGRIRYMEHLISDRDFVNVDMGRYAQYQLRGDDFYDLVRDLVEGTQTLDYRIREVKNNRGRLTIVADHLYRDPWGREKSTRHYYGLEEDRRGGYQIVAFKVD